MSAIWTRRFVDGLIVLFALALLGGVIKMGGAIAEGKFDMLSWPASSTHVEVTPLGDRSANWDMSEGSVRVLDHTVANGFSYVMRFLSIGLAIAALWQLRGFVARIAKGAVFIEANIAAMRRIGWLLVAICGVSVVTTIVLQSVILGAIPTLESQVVHPSLSSTVRGVENIWLEYSPPIMPFLLAMIAFITAGAFRSGQQYREDSESVV